MSVSHTGRGYVRPAVSLETRHGDRSAAVQQVSRLDMKVIAGQCVSLISRGYLGTHPALPAAQRIPVGGGLIKTPPRDEGRQPGQLLSSQKNTNQESAT